MKKSLVIILALIALYSYSYAQPHIEWQKCYGGSRIDKAYSMAQTTDGGFIVAGCSESKDGDVIGNHESEDYWVIKLDSLGTNQWERCLGGTQSDFALSIQQTNDGGFITAGSSFSNDGDVTGHHGTLDSCDYWIVKLNASGEIQWQKSLGGNFDDYATSIQQANDSGFVVAGWTLSNNGDVTGNHGNKDCWIVKLNSSGDIQWQKCLGGSNTEEARAIQQTKDGGYIVAGCSFSNNGDVTVHHNDSIYTDCWIVKLDSSGEIQWQKSLGGNSDDWAYSIQQINGGFIVAAITRSSDGDVTRKNNGWSTIWIVKLDVDANIIWEKSMGGSRGNQTYAIQQTSDGGYILAGYSNSDDGDVKDHHGSTNYYDAWIIKLDSEGCLQWQKSYGGTKDEYTFSIHQTRDDGFVIAGFSNSNDCDVSGNHGGYDYWIVKLSPDITNVEDNPNQNKLELSISPNPSTNTINLTYPDNMYGEQIKIFNTMGILVWSGIADGETKTIDISRFPSVAYFLRVGKETGIFIKE
jgi:hypothetical protein